MPLIILCYYSYATRSVLFVCLFYHHCHIFLHFLVILVGKINIMMLIILLMLMLILTLEAVVVV